MSEDAMRPGCEILWEEQRGVINLRAVREGDIVRIEAGVEIHATRSFTQAELEQMRFDVVAYTKTELVQQIAEACKQLYLDVNS
jgi:hypothetical protein